MTSLKYFVRPVNRIDYILSELKNLWRFYPDHSLLLLVMEGTIYANHVDSELPVVSYLDIEEIDYPQDHYLSGKPNLEMGFKFLREGLNNKPVELNDDQVKAIERVGENWRKQPQMRLGQLLTGENLMAKMKYENQVAYQ